MVFVWRPGAVSGAFLIFFTALGVGGAVLGRAIRVKQLLNGLNPYDTEMLHLKAKHDKLCISLNKVRSLPSGQ